MKPDEKVVKKNILEVAYEQISNTYPKLMPFIVKYGVHSIDQENKSASGSFFLVIKDELVVIPILYRDGNVDAISYIGNDQTGDYYALTNLLYLKLVNEAVNNLGKVVSNNQAQPIDRGVIGALFATPTTFSPKVASEQLQQEADVTLSKIASELGMEPVRIKTGLGQSDLIMDMAFQDQDFAQDLLKKASENTALGKVLREVVDVDEVSKYTSLSKLASHNVKYTNPTVYFSMDQIKNINSSKKPEALQKIATQGFYVDNAKEEKIADFSYEKTAEAINDTIYSNLTEITNTGAYSCFDTNMELQNVVCAKGLRPWMLDRKTCYTADLVEIENSNRSSTALLGVPFTATNKQNLSIIFNKRITTLDNIHSATGVKNLYTLFITLPGGELYEATIDENDLTRVNDGYTISIDGKVGAMDFYYIKVTDKVNRILNNQGVLTIPFTSLLVVRKERGVRPKSVTGYLNSSNILDLTAQKLPIIKVANVGPDKFLLNGINYSKEGLVIKLAQEGYTETSIHSIVKTAASNPSSEQLLMGLSQQIAQLTQTAQQQSLTMSQIAQLLASLKKDTVAAKRIAQVQAKAQVQQTRLQKAQVQAQAQQAQAQQAQGQQVQAQAQQAQAQQAQGQQDPNAQAQQAQAQQAQAQQAQAQQDPNAQAQQDPSQGQDEQAQLIQAIQEMAKQMGVDGNKLIQQAQQQGVSLQDLFTQLQNYMQQGQQAQAQGQQAQGQQDPNAQAQQAQTQGQQDPNAQAQQAQAQPGQPQPGQPGQQGGSDLPPSDPNGFVLPNIDPNVLNTLQNIANKQVTESTILSYLTDIYNPKGIVKQYSDSVKSGITGLVKILLIIEINYKTLSKQVSESTLSSFLNRGKSLAKRLTDFYINLENL